MAIVNQITSLVADSAAEALGVKTGQLDTTDIVSLGKQLASMDLYDKWFNSLVNRITKTIYFVRTYSGNERNVMRDESEYGAFVQKVYYKMPDEVDNPTWSIPQVTSESGSDVYTYGQASPYDVEGTVGVSSVIFGGKGTWSIEIVRPVEQIKTAFLSASEMAAFIDGIYTVIENKMKLDEERLVADAVNTAMAQAISNGKARNLLSEYNTAHATATLTVAQALESPEFHRYAVREISKTIRALSNMSVLYNAAGYETFTPKDKLVVEMLSQFAADNEIYLQSDTFHNELVKLPMFQTVDYWQMSGTTINQDFAYCSKINVAHDDLDDPVAQAGIICSVRDYENVAAYFGNRRQYELFNPRSEVMIHIEKAEKGYAVDDHANHIVFYIA